MTQKPDQHLRLASMPSVDAGAIVQEHWAGVYRLIYRLCANSHDAEELTQEAFLRAFQKFNQFQPGTNLRAWLLRIATNAFLDSRKRKASISLNDHAIDPADSSAPVPAIEQSELSQHLFSALQKLPDTQRVVFLARTTEDLSFRDISEMIGTSEATARWHMLQARQQLLKLLEGKL